MPEEEERRDDDKDEKRDRSQPRSERESRKEDDRRESPRREDGGKHRGRSSDREQSGDRDGDKTRPKCDSDEKAFAVGVEVRIKATGEVGKVRGSNGHASKVGGAWFHNDDVEIVAQCKDAPLSAVDIEATAATSAAPSPALSASATSPDAAEECRPDGRSLPATQWPEHFKAIPRIRYPGVDKLLEVMKSYADAGEPLIVEGSKVINTDVWANMDHLLALLGDRKVLVKRSPSNKFRYFDLKKNVGEYDFRQPLEETQQSLPDFMAESERILQEGSNERMYLQETLSGHGEMAEEFVSWNWELLIKASHQFGWGLPDSNELFIGMCGVETPLHFDERENLFFQVRGRKEICIFPFTDYTRLYPFPTTHPCDRQSMVGDPRSCDGDAFPSFRDAVGHHSVLQDGDLLYLPYGWWHWLRNLDHLPISVSFWSTTPPSDLSKGVPTTFSDHMLTRVRRNLESMVAGFEGPTKHNATMLGLREAVVEKKAKDPYLQKVRGLLAAVRMPVDKQDAFLLEMIDGRFGIDWNKHV